MESKLCYFLGGKGDKKILQDEVRDEIVFEIGRQ